jgi:hypothetical protein
MRYNSSDVRIVLPGMFTGRRRSAAEDMIQRVRFKYFSTQLAEIGFCELSLCMRRGSAEAHEGSLETNAEDHGLRLRSPT